MDYYFSDFTEDNYKRLLTIIKDKFQFYHYDKWDKIDKGVIWRHDIDYSVHRAAKLSKIEKQIGVSSTWFVLLHSPFYNVWEKEIRDLLLYIIDNGGEIGLHFDPAFYNLKNTELNRLEQLIEEEKNFLQRLIGQDIKVFSFHNPDVNGGFMNIDRITVAGLINVYCHKIRDLYQYCSDSNGYWRFKRLQSVIENAGGDEKLHILTHPTWWQADEMAPRERILRCANGRAKNVMCGYDDEMKKNNRINVGK